MIISKVKIWLNGNEYFSHETQIDVSNQVVHGVIQKLRLKIYCEASKFHQSVIIAANSLSDALKIKEIISNTILKEITEAQLKREAKIFADETIKKLNQIDSKRCIKKSEK